MTGRDYYSVRTGKRPGGHAIDLPTLKRLFLSIYSEFEQKGWFQEAFGYNCIDAGFVPGTAGKDLENYFGWRLRNFHSYPIAEMYGNYSEEILFDTIELLYDHISEPVDGTYHSWGDCGWHYTTFNKSHGQTSFRERINLILKDYKDGFELSEQGEILASAEQGMDFLLDAELPKYDEQNIDRIVAASILKFRRHRSSTTERKEAVRALADVLEFLRPKLKHALTKKDETDLFNIANNFAIRHHNVDQKNEYDQPIWLSWIFYFYLATIHAAIRLIKRQDSSEPKI